MSKKQKTKTVFDSNPQPSLLEETTLRLSRAEIRALVIQAAMQKDPE